LAVCSAGGAITGTSSNKWDNAYAEALRGRHVILLPDNDKAGEDHVKNVAAGLKGIAASVKIVRLPDLSEKGDVSDWLEAGGTREQLEAMAASSEEAAEEPTSPVDDISAVDVAIEKQDLAAIFSLISVLAHSQRLNISPMSKK
jgi:DNA primase